MPGSVQYKTLISVVKWLYDGALTIFHKYGNKWKVTICGLFQSKEESILGNTYVFSTGFERYSQQEGQYFFRA